MILSGRIFLLASVLAFFVSCGEKTPPQGDVEEQNAPVLLSTDPADGVKDAPSPSMTVKFSFDQKIMCTDAGIRQISVDGDASVGRVTVGGFDISVDVDNLRDGATYTLCIPEGVIQGYKKNQKKTPAISYTFTTFKEEPLPPDPPGPADSEGWEYASSAVHRMRVGWNLGNTLEANSGNLQWMWIEAWTDRSTSAYETAWGQPVATSELIHMFKEAGFNTIRVPVTWYPHMGKFDVSVQMIDGEATPVGDFSTWTGYDVNPVWMARVKEVVDYVIDEGMYCILNVHHDTGDASTAWLRADPKAYEQYRERYAELWKQIADEFAGYGQTLLFESFNEMLDMKGTWNYSTSEAHETINKWNADFVATVRATGGNNAHRNLILNTYAASTDPRALADFRLPEDSADHHLMAEVHSYAPYLFAFDQDAGRAVNEFNDACDREVRSIIGNLNTYLVSRGIPCVLGEYGCTGSRSEEERAKQAACYVSAAAEYDIACVYWMALSDTDDRKVPKWTCPKIKDAIIKAYKENRKK